MKAYLKSIALAGLAASACFAQQWEIGASAGAGFTRSASVTARAGGSAKAGFKPGVTFGASLTQHLYKHVSGEIRYGYLMNDLRVKSGGQEASFTGESHVLHYDVLLHPAASQEAKVEYFGILGGGMKVFRGTGTETAYQALSQFVYLTKTREVKPMLSVGGGMRYKLSPKVAFRAEFRDYITPFPKEVITPAFGATLKGSLLHNFVPMAGIAYAF